MAFNDLGRGILELFFEAQRHGCFDEIEQEMVILSRVEHRKTYKREWEADDREQKHLRAVHYEERACPTCGRRFLVVVGDRKGRLRVYDRGGCKAKACRLRQSAPTP
ncbi:MAG: hypothetical protein WC563_16270 [Brevundimonas sp.]